MDERAPRRKARLYEGIVREIETLIRNGVLGPGDQLLPERQLAEQLGVSRGAVREALSALAARGLVQIRPGGGAYVAHRSVAPIVDLLGTVLLYDEDRAADLLEALQALEAAVAGIAARHVSRQELQCLREAADAFEKAVAEDRPASEENARFHKLIAEATHNAILVDFMAMINGLVAAVHGEAQTALLSAGGDQACVFCDQHREVLAALERKDGVAAGRTMSAHMLSVRESMVALARELRARHPE